MTKPPPPSAPIPPARQGRPRTVSDTRGGSVVSAYLAAPDHDRLVNLARAQRTSVSSVVRQLLVVRLPTPSK